MGQYEKERILTVLYSLATCLSIITVSTSAAAWVHWSEILDTCANYRCGCILYGSSHFSAFMGGHVPFCHFATFASIPVLIISLVLACYHGYRVCIVPRRRKSRSTTRPNQRRHGEMRVINSPQEEPAWAGTDPGYTCWIFLSILAIIIACLLLTNAAILTSGYYNTCDEYRRTLVKSLVASGQTAAAIYGRLSCGAIFDFMDYIEPVTRPFRELEGVYYDARDERRDFFRGDFINTALALQLAIGSAWINVIIWISVIVYYIILARVDGKCTFCCCKS